MLLGRCAVQLLGVQHLSSILPFSFYLELDIFLQKLFPGSLDFHLEPSIRKANLLTIITPLREDGCAYWLAEKALPDPNMRSDTSNSRSDIGLASLAAASLFCFSFWVSWTGEMSATLYHQASREHVTPSDLEPSLQLLRRD